MSKPKILSVEPADGTGLFSVEKVNLEFSNGQRRTYERLCNAVRRAVMILPILNDDTILLIREYGVGIEDYHLSLPKGGVEENEDLLETANRELKEETGYGAKDLRHFTALSSSPGYSRAHMDVVLAKDLYPCACEGDEPEPIEVVHWPLADVDRLIQHPDFHEARALAALLLFAREQAL